MNDEVPARVVVDVDAFAVRAPAVLCRYPDVAAAWVFGSAARGEPAADLDIGIATFDGHPDARRLAALASDLERETQPGVPVDLRALDGAEPRFRYNVVRSGRLLWERDRSARVEFAVRAVSEWLDFRPAWERMRRAMLERCARG